MSVKQKNAKPQEVKLTSLVQFPLLPDEVETVQTYVVSPKDAIEYVNALIEQGYRLDIMPNGNGNGVSILIKFSRESMLNAGSGFYSNGLDFTQAVAVLMFKLNALGGNLLEDFLSDRATSKGIS